MVSARTPARSVHTDISRSKIPAKPISSVPLLALILQENEHSNYGSSLKAELYSS